MSLPVWNYRITLQGNVEHDCRVTLENGHLLWEISPVDEFEEDGEKSSCLQPIASFREFGPPETPAFLQAPASILDAMGAAVGAPAPPWREPLPANVSALFAAARAGCIDDMRALLNAGVSVNVRDHQRRNALWYAADARTLEPTEWLLDAGADVNAQDRYGRTVLMDAALLNRELLADLYKLKGADLTLRDDTGRTAWLIGVESKAGRGMMFSIRACVQEDWCRALHLAARCGNIEWMEGEEWFIENWKPNMNTREGKFHRTPLQQCLNGWRPLPQAVRWLIEHGADLHVVDEQDGSTPLHHAARQNLPWMIPACLQAGVDVNARDHSGRTALDDALKKENPMRFLQALHASGIDVPDLPPRTPLAARVTAPSSSAPRWEWKARTWNGRVETWTVTLRRDILIWEGDNSRREQPIAQFLIEGPPRNGGFYRTLPREALESLCESLGDHERTWELPCPTKEREARVKEWQDAQTKSKPAAPTPPPPPPSHQSGKWCYARIDIEDHFTTPSGAGSDGQWCCWMEFPAEWVQCDTQHLEQWLTEALQRAYLAMNEKASGPDGGHYTLRCCWPVVLSRAEAIKQPWADPGKVLYQVVDGESTPVSLSDDQRRRPFGTMGS